ncbi:hypothetical protein [[Phormidium] sp. ETS-05]|nr:hypothetical protein [[Phormidium] sp. ETS-05]
MLPLPWENPWPEGSRQANGFRRNHLGLPDISRPILHPEAGGQQQSQE